jgi:hypothetical protein
LVLNIYELFCSFRKSLLQVVVFLNIAVASALGLHGDMLEHEIVDDTLHGLVSCQSAIDVILGEADGHSIDEV